MTHSLHKQKGNSLPAIFFMIVVFGFLFLFTLEEMDKKSEMKELLSQHPVEDSTYYAVLESSLNSPQPTKELSGAYYSAVKSKGKTAEIEHYFTSLNTPGERAGVLVRKVTVPGNDDVITGSAKFTIQGSTLKFTDFTGSRALFYKSGEPFYLEGSKFMYWGGESYIEAIPSALKKELEASKKAMEDSRVQELLDTPILEMSSIQLSEYLRLNIGLFIKFAISLLVIGIFLSFIKRRRMGD